ncbi:MAG: T9SS type A sorting domain-containing protein, partial [Candidatus Muiribacteriota bacterium]
VSEINKDIFGDFYNGGYKIIVQGGKDTSGNLMGYFTSQTFYIYPKPKIDTPKIFPNPLDDREIMVLVKPKQPLKQNPKVIIDSEDVEFSLLDRSWYGASHRIQSNQNGIRTLQISITDIHGNTSHWPDDYEALGEAQLSLFRTAVINRSSSFNMASVDESVEVSLQEDSIEKDSEDVYSLSYDEEEIKASGAPNFAGHEINKNELERLTGNTVFAPALKLQKEGEITFKNVYENTEGLCIMKKNSTGWEYVNTRITEDEIIGEIDSLGTYALFIDGAAPRIAENISHNQPLIDGKKDIVVEVSEEGSGLKKVILYLNGKIVKKSHNNKLSYSPENYYSEGENEIVVHAYDNAGNKSESQLMFMAPGAVEVESLNVYPNPVSNIAQFNFKLDSLAENVGLRIYSMGNRLVYRDSISNTDEGNFVWTLNDKRGRTVSNGTYIYELIFEGNEKRVSRGKISVIK